MLTSKLGHGPIASVELVKLVREGEGEEKGEKVGCARYILQVLSGGMRV